MLGTFQKFSKFAKFVLEFSHNLQEILLKLIPPYLKFSLVLLQILSDVSSTIARNIFIKMLTTFVPRFR